MFLLPLVALSLAALALVFRSVQMDLRPLHTDEAIHAVKFGSLLDEGSYTYNPHEFHGPTIYYFALPLAWASGISRYADLENAVPLRLVAALFGTALVLLPLLFRQGIGLGAALIAGLLTAVSPAFVFYSRYYIQEILLVFFTWGAIAAAWRYIRGPRFSWALVVGTAAGLAQATKETAVIFWGCAAAAAGLTVVLAHGLERQHREPQLRFRLRHPIAAVVLAALVSAAFLSNFFRNPAAIVDAVTAYATYFGRAATGTGHETGLGAHVQPWYYYFHLLSWFRGGSGHVWSEGLVLVLALVGALVAFHPRLTPPFNRHLVRFIAIYVLLMAVVFSVIPYKTPWNLLGFYYGAILLAGTGAATLLHAVPGRVAKGIVAGCLAAGALHLGNQAVRANFTYPADPVNPWVYGHTSTNLIRLVERIEALSAVSSDGKKLPISIIANQDDYWPLPWYLRRYQNVGFWSEIPEQFEAPIIVISPGLEERLTPRLKENYIQEFYGLRPDILLSVYIRESLWQQFLKAQEKAS